MFVIGVVLLRVRVWLLVALCIAMSSAWGFAQSAAAKSGTSASGSASGSPGFSIQTEMLTYRALETNSESVACDVAAFINGIPVTYTTSANSSQCSVKSNSSSGVVLLPFGADILDGFQLWRADMEIMGQLNRRGSKYCAPKYQIRVGDSKGATADIAALTPAGGAAMSLVQGVFATLASNADSMQVVGTIQDQAFLDGVARQLRVLNVPVLMPASSLPFSLNGLDETKSPFLTKFNEFLEDRTCVIVAAKMDAKGNYPDLPGLQSEMDTFLSSLSGTVAPKQPSGGGSGATPPTNPAPPAPTPGSSPSPLVAILEADGLAQKLNIDPGTGASPANGSWKHILFLRALESGGSVDKQSNVLGTKIWYSGGSVGTYALFTLDGEMECSGNVFDFGGSAPAKGFQQEVGKFTPDPASQLIYQRGGCALGANH
jgi:hypothetical protein